MSSAQYDLYTLIAGAALKEGQTFHLKCNCGGTAPITPPTETEFVVCPKCMSKIKFLVVDGDPGYIIGRNSSGEPTLLPVQGSTAKPIHELSADERKEILDRVKKQLGKQKK